jgi:hypothetical protein
MATVKLTVSVRDLDNRVRVRESREVSVGGIAEQAEKIGGAISRAFSKVSVGRRSGD